MGLKTFQIQTRKDDPQSRIAVKMPEHEAFRIKEIFVEGGYALPWFNGADGTFTVADVGANVGLFALFMHMQNPSADITSFEPAPESFALLRENVAPIARCALHNVALSNTSGEQPFFLHPQSTGGHSLTTAEGRNPDPITVQVQHASEALTAVLDSSAAGRIDVLKIDTEGSEVPILTAAASVLPRTDMVLLEYHSEADRRTLDSLLQDFVLFGAHTKQPDLGVVKYIRREVLEKARAGAQANQRAS